MAGNTFGPMNGSYPTLQDFVDGIVAVRGVVELIKQPLYDRILYPTAGVAGNLQFFTTPVGQGISTESGGTATTPKGIADTIMTQPGILPAPQAFWVDNIQVLVDPGSVATASLFVTQPPTLFNATAAATVQAGINDKNAILNSGALLLTVGTKPYYQLAPLDQFPPQARKRIDTSAGIAGTNAQPAAYGAQLMYADGALGVPLRKLDPGVPIPTGMQFNVQLIWPGLIATASGFNARIAVHLDGWQIRAAQ